MRPSFRTASRSSTSSAVVASIRARLKSSMSSPWTIWYSPFWQVQGKPENVIAKIVEGKLDKFYSTVCLLEQGFIKNPDQTIKELLATKISQLGENMVIRRFTRYLVGEALEGETNAPAEAEAAS